MSDFEIEDHLIPLGKGQSITPGWTTVTHGGPRAITWHWTATWDLEHCTRLLGGPNAERKGIASAHLAIGRSFEDGVHRYVRFEDRSWHAGKNQTLKWNGRRYHDPRTKASRTTVGLETINIGYARPGVEAEDDWLEVWTPDGLERLWVQPWTEEQVLMMISIGRSLVERWPIIGPRDHHGHHDICPGYKVDPVGFPFARVVRGVHDDPTVPDVWSEFWGLAGRRRALGDLGYAPDVDDAPWGPQDDDALRRFQADHGMVVNGMWSTFTGWKLHDLGWTGT